VDVEVSGVAANALGARRIGSICFDLATRAGVSSITVCDDSIADAQALLWKKHRILVEPAGATALAALLQGAYVPDADEKVAVLICGGNIAPDPFL
jgi:threonine dehydratase